MKVYALVGFSGTGKSYKASSVAKENNIEYVIDDGLFIRGSKVLAGTSAKKEPTMVAAVKRALFLDESHANKVKKSIDAHIPDSILILGTSIKMINRITNRLSLPNTYKVIRIEDVSTQKEIDTASNYRKEQGKHVIPVPTFEVKKDFSGFFIDPLRIFRVLGRGGKVETLEKTIVRPTYSYLGRFYISNSTIQILVAYNIKKNTYVSKIFSIDCKSVTDGVKIYVEVEMVYGCSLYKELKKIQKQIVIDIERLTGMNIIGVNIKAKELLLDNSYQG